MKALEWHQFLRAQKERYGKTLFRVAELANVAGRDPHALNVELSRLVRNGVMVRYSTGVYGPPEGVTPEDLVPVLDDDAYITGMYALNKHNLITQTPTEITCFTRRRHNRSRTRITPLGRVVFVSVSGRVHSKPKKGILASPEQALCDFVYLLRRQGMDPVGAVTFRNLNRLSDTRLNACLKRYPSTIRTAIRSLTPRVI